MDVGMLSRWRVHLTALSRAVPTRGLVKGRLECLCLALRPIEALKRDWPARFGNTETVS